MSKLGSLYALSDEFINNAILSSPAQGHEKAPDVQTRSSSAEESKQAAKKQTPETDQGMTCLTCGIGMISTRPRQEQHPAFLAKLSCLSMQQALAGR